MKDHRALRQASTAARQFALANTMEMAWDKRAARLPLWRMEKGAAARCPRCCFSGGCSRGAP